MKNLNTPPYLFILLLINVNPQAQTSRHFLIGAFCMQVWLILTESICGLFKMYVETVMLWFAFKGKSRHFAS